MIHVTYTDSTNCIVIDAPARVLIVNTFSTVTSSVLVNLYRLTHMRSVRLQFSYEVDNENLRIKTVAKYGWSEIWNRLTKWAFETVLRGSGHWSWTTVAHVITNFLVSIRTLEVDITCQAYLIVPSMTSSGIYEQWHIFQKCAWKKKPIDIELSSYFFDPDFGDFQIMEHQMQESGVTYTTWRIVKNMSASHRSHDWVYVWIELDTYMQASLYI